MGKGLIFGIEKENFFTIFMLLFNVLSWYYAAWVTLNRVLEEVYDVQYRTLVLAFFFLAIATCGIAGSILSKKVKITNFLYWWMFLGVIGSLLLGLPLEMTHTNALLITLFLAMSFGLGMPSCMAYFADLTTIENRGRTAGSILLAVNFVTTLFVILVMSLDVAVTSMVLAIWRTLGLILFFFFKPPGVDLETRKDVSFSSVFQNRSFIIYVVAWLMFCSVDRFEKPILENSLDPHFYSSMLLMEPIISSIFAFIAGFVCDHFGRKRVVISGFVALGLAYAMISIYPVTVSLYLYFVIDAISAGMLWITLLIVLWGDLSPQGSREKYYAIGTMPYFLTPLIPYFLGPVVTLPSSAAFSLASFFLFLAVLPLLYAPETLPEREIELRRLRKYVEKARKVKEKHEED